MDFPTRRSNLEQFTVSEFVEWHHQNKLKLNPKFQRRPVWTNDARSYLIDTMLLGFPIPKVYLRTTIDIRTKASIRDVVDGQQRLRAILDFADDKLVLNRRSERFSGKRYSQLEEEVQHAFLAYPIGVEQLINATDSFVLQVFSRLNSYTLPLNPAEKRHALYETELKWFIHELSNNFRWFLERYEIVSTTTMVRMADDVFFAELVNVLVNGIDDSGSVALDKLYKAHPGDFLEAGRFEKIIKEGIAWLDQELPSLLSDTILNKPYQLQVLFAAYVHQTHGLPKGRMEEMPARRGIDRIEAVTDRLSILAQAVETDDEESPYKAFVNASSGATTRFASRRVRFLAFNDAIMVR